MTIRLLLVDDHGVVRQGLRMYLAMEPDLTIVGEAKSGSDALEQVALLHPDVVLMDVLMPGMSGIEATRLIRQQYPDVEVIVMTSVLDDTVITQALQAGASGYLLKNTEAEALCTAIKAAASGQVQLSPEVAERMMSEVTITGSPDSLTDRELEVLALLVDGLSNRAIADTLVIGEKTVKTHVSNILSKFDVNSRTQAVLYALRVGLVSRSEAS